MTWRSLHFPLFISNIRMNEMKYNTRVVQMRNFFSRLCHAVDFLVFTLSCYHIEKEENRKRGKNGLAVEQSISAFVMICFYSWWFYETLIAIIVASGCAQLPAVAVWAKAKMLLWFFLRCNIFLHNMDRILYELLSWLINYVENILFVLLLLLLLSRNEI